MSEHRDKAFRLRQNLGALIQHLDQRIGTTPTPDPNVVEVLPGTLEPFGPAYRKRGVPVPNWKPTGDDLADHPFIIGMKVSRAGDVHYHKRFLQPRRSTIPILGAVPQAAHPTLVAIENPNPQYRPGRPGKINLQMQIVPVDVLVLETFGEGLGDSSGQDPGTLRDQAWATWCAQIGVLTSHPQTKKDLADQDKST